MFYFVSVVHGKESGYVFLQKDICGKSVCQISSQSLLVSQHHLLGTLSPPC